VPRDGPRPRTTSRRGLRRARTRQRRCRRFTLARHPTKEVKRVLEEQSRPAPTSTNEASTAGHVSSAHWDDHPQQGHRTAKPSHKVGAAARRLVPRPGENRKAHRPGSRWRAFQSGEASICQIPAPRLHPDTIRTCDLCLRRENLNAGGAQSKTRALVTRWLPRLGASAGHKVEPTLHDFPALLQQVGPLIRPVGLRSVVVGSAELDEIAGETGRGRDRAEAAGGRTGAACPLAEGGGR
jgi:hypothetical protein